MRTQTPRPEHSRPAEASVVSRGLNDRAAQARSTLDGRRASRRSRGTITTTPPTPRRTTVVGSGAAFTVMLALTAPSC
jgi:hypothetical protein